MAGVKQLTSTDSLLIDRITQHGPGWVFTPADFADLGTSQAVRHALVRNAQKGMIRQLHRGLYEFPRQHPKLGILSPSPEAVAKAIQSRDATRLQPSGAYAANLLGISEQVPAKIVFYTDGQSRMIQVGNQQIVLKRRSSRMMATAGRPSGLVISALEELGSDNVNEEVLSQIRRSLDKDALRSLAADARYAPAWIADCMRKLSETEDKQVHG
ncbi:MAG: DUF6088 family protein [Candidatus Sumerlaeia bacterium]|nr:DUF6088 family protein [Candidatus Sumerlaeia bacterium]